MLVLPCRPVRVVVGVGIAYPPRWDSPARCELGPLLMHPSCHCLLQPSEKWMVRFAARNTADFAESSAPGARVAHPPGRPHVIRVIRLPRLWGSGTHPCATLPVSDTHQLCQTATLLCD